MSILFDYNNNFLLMQTYIDCLHIKKTDNSRMAAEDPMEVDNPSSRNVENFSFDEEKVYHFILFSPLEKV
jgi:hypothetical protein